jgi:hypothetical protein
VVIPVHLTRNIGYGGISEGGTLPTAGNQGYAATSFRTKYHYANIMVTDVMMRRTKGDKGAFARALESEIKGALTDLSKYLNILMFGDGSGKLAKCTLSSNTAWVNVITSRNLQGSAIIDVLDSTGADVAADRTISSVASATLVKVSGSAFTTAPTDFVAMANSYSNVVMGLDGIVSASDPITGDFQGIDRATYDVWKSNVIGNSGTARTLTLALLEQAINTAQRWGGKTNLIVSNFGPRKEYLGLCQTNKRFVNQMELDGGFKALEFDGVGWTVDSDAPYNTTTNGKIYFLDTKHLTHFRQADFTWLDDDGNVLFRDATTASFKATLVYDAEFGTDKPRAHCLLDDVLLTTAEIE